jgi:UPF0755 protein
MKKRYSFVPLNSLFPGMKHILKWMLIGMPAVIMLFSITAYRIYYAPALDIQQEYVLRVHPHTRMDDVYEELTEKAGLQYPYIFRKMCEKMNVAMMLRPGIFKFKPEMNMREVAVSIRKGGVQTVNVVIRGSTDYSQILQYISQVFDMELDQLMGVFHDETRLKEAGFNLETLPALFIPDTYNMYYLTDADGIFQHMVKQYRAFWNANRLLLAKEIGLQPIQVSILASIVDKETTKADEMNRVAGVYMNRLKKGQKLQADPTVKFAWNQPDLKRIRNKHLEIEHPYNTYHIYGLPPGPLYVPSQQSLMSVLRYERHDYYFFCARPDYSGYHQFSRTHDEHVRHAAQYHRFLDKEGY